jgi:predicted CDP-diglyceride synthetase/phosphatidate cytidylyltransferase
MVGYLTAQCLDGVLTYLGVTIWGLRIEANPLVSSAMDVAGLAGGLLAAKLIAVAFGALLHLRRVHTLVAVLTMFYFTAAILPWTALFLTQ